MLLALIQPILLFIFAAAIGGLWAWRRQNLQLAFMAIGFALFGLGLVIQITEIPAGVVPNAIASALAYGSGVTVFAIGVLTRAGVPERGFAPAFVGAVMVAGIWYFAAVDYNLMARVYILNFGLGLVLLAGAWLARSLRHGTATDRILFWLVVGLGLHFFPRTILTAGSIVSDGPGDFGQTLFWRTATFASAILGLVMGIGIIVLTMADVIASTQKERDTDPLTGLANRRGLEAEARRLMADPAFEPISLIVCDLDNFKSVNDRFGHAAGDEVLRIFADTLRENTRGHDLLARQGGEEFVALLPRFPAEQALAFAERLRLAVAAHSFDEAASGLSVTCSLGVVQIKKGETLEAALARADELLYAAKHNGRNRTYAERIGPVGRKGKSPGRA